jgi:iron only hydrogenase large subunit-like protein
MACAGGCIGGPKRILDVEEAKQRVEEYAEKAGYRTPGENPYVIDLIRRLGFGTVEEFLEGSDILERRI